MIITEKSKVFKALEEKLNKQISLISEGEDEWCIHFKDGSHVYCVINVIFDLDITMNITLLSDDFYELNKFNILIN